MGCFKASLLREYSEVSVIPRTKTNNNSFFSGLALGSTAGFITLYGAEFGSEYNWIIICLGGGCEFISGGP